MTKTREEIVEDLISHAKILGGGVEDWQFIENIIFMGMALLEIDHDGVEEDSTTDHDN